MHAAGMASADPLGGGQVSMPAKMFHVCSRSFVHKIAAQPLRWRRYFLLKEPRHECTTVFGR